MFESPNAFVGRSAAPESGKQEGQKLKKSFRGGGTLRASNPRRRRRGVRGAKGRDAEGVQGMGTGYPLPSRLGDFVGSSVVSSPSGVRGRVPAKNDFYRAMLCIRGTSHGPVSVCLSVSVSVTSWREFY